MPRKKKVKEPETLEDAFKKIALECIEGKYGQGLTMRQNVNRLGYGYIYPQIKKYVTMIKAGQL